MRSGRRVADALRGAGVEVRVLDADATLLAALAADPPDVVIPLLHGAGGGGRRGPRRSRAARHSVRRLASGTPAAEPSTSRSPRRRSTGPGWTSPAAWSLPHATFRELGAAAVLDALVAPARPAADGQAHPRRVGAGRLGRRPAPRRLPAAMVAAFAYGDTALVERSGPRHRGRGVRRRPRRRSGRAAGGRDRAGRRRSTTTPRATPPEPPSSSRPPRLDAAAAQRCARAALTAHDALGLRDLSRSDLIVDAPGPRGSSRSTSPRA